MASAPDVAHEIKRPDAERANTVALAGIAVAIAILHVLTNGRYGFHRDELQTLNNAMHLEWGFVAFPPLTPFLERIGLDIFGVSLVGLRLFSVLAQAVAIFMTGLMARELGGRRTAQIAAALAVALSPLSLFEGTEFQYTSFDYLWWVLAAYFIIRLLKTENQRWWLAAGAAVGLGLMTKYTMAFLVAGILAGLLLTKARRFLTSGWFWAGAGLAALIALPNFWWQIQHGFISYHFLQHIHARDIGEGRAQGFLKDQFLICTNVISAPLWIAGVVGFLLSRRYRMLAWMYLVPLALFWFGKGRGYYMGAAYPVLLAMGAVVAERWLASISRRWRRGIETAFYVSLVACGGYICAIVVPLAASGPLRNFALQRNGDLREEIGWNDLVKSVAAIRDSLPQQEQQTVGVVTGNYGELGAVAILGPAYHLPQPIGGTNSAWLRGYPNPAPSPLIVLGYPQSWVEKMFTGCRLAGHNGTPGGIRNEESVYHPDIFLCDSPRLPWPEFWKKFQSFG